MKVSTITPCFRMEKYLKKFLEELPKQTYFSEMEVVLDHNEPTQKEIEWVTEFQAKYPGRLKHIIVDKVDPIGTSMNRCIKESSGKYLTIWNVDDLRTPDSIQKQAFLLDTHKECGIANTNFVIVREFGATYGQLVDHSQYLPDSGEFTRSMILGPFFMFRRSLLQKSGYFDEQLKSGADFDLAIRLSIHSDAVYCTPGVGGYYLDEGKGASTRGDGRQQTERTVIELRYGISDKIEKQWLPKTESYRIKEILEFGTWNDVEKYVPEYGSFVLRNGTKR